MRDLPNLQFDGDDQFLTFGRRHLGIGPFSMAPGAWGDDDSARSALIASYEDTQSMHGPTDRAAMAALSTKCAPIPTDVSGMLRVVDHLEIQLTILVTAACPLVLHIHTLVMLLRGGALFVTYRPHDFTLFMWSLHTSCRQFFQDRETFIIERLVVDIKSRLQINTQLSADLRAPPPNMRDTSRSVMNPSEYTLPGMTRKRQKTAEDLGARLHTCFARISTVPSEKPRQVLSWRTSSVQLLRKSRHSLETSSGPSKPTERSLASSISYLEDVKREIAATLAIP
jgi:hypothetical protein